MSLIISEEKAFFLLEIAASCSREAACRRERSSSTCLGARTGDGIADIWLQMLYLGLPCDGFTKHSSNARLLTHRDPCQSCTRGCNVLSGLVEDGHDIGGING